MKLNPCACVAWMEVRVLDCTRATAQESSLLCWTVAIFAHHILRWYVWLRCRPVPATGNLCWGSAAFWIMTLNTVTRRTSIAFAVSAVEPFGARAKTSPVFESYTSISDFAPFVDVTHSPLIYCFVYSWTAILGNE
jgi:hypothetical protein